MPVIVDTVLLLKLIHNGFALADERSDEPIRKCAQSLLSALTFHLRHPSAEMSDAIAADIRFLENKLQIKDGQQTSRRRKRV